MSKTNPYLRFPSGRTVKDVKRDAKRFARTADISHSAALDTLARVNGLDLCWPKAMVVLAEKNRPWSDLAPYRRLKHAATTRRPRANSEQPPIPSRHLSRRVKLGIELYRDGQMSIEAIAKECCLTRSLLEFHIHRVSRRALNEVAERCGPPVRSRPLRQLKRGPRTLKE